ncbi:exopolysaccharide biosynthesis polyprenyl glycosylphosphotransferase [Streptacidiphilus sp. PB12-B1b]|uniref:exopolysaccharide biosynthesis polyprenyl glycosylphosphotransferase n=1 Tax=Streptacidiphilus sp. PB12-B1b TaxID=2705012 RepID=UPI0015F8363E|nr:exopolysaccharide biosynthesis polyprenyl glycosylphosphotransferase [Streptacidiphilus sp. PB12-B1b]QMU77836.1 exopolysaccharide biosynthesis polyprenyl glycosylphosphotransferase [Streptacidiphilus sp. PB12-B1b]
MGLVLSLQHEAAHSWLVALVTAVAWVGVGLARGRYTRHSLGETAALRPVLWDWFVLLGLLAVFRTYFELSLLPGPSLVALVLLLLITCARRKLTQRRLLRMHRMGLAVQRVLVVGTPRAVDSVVDRLAKQTHHEYVVVGACLVGEGEPGTGTTVAGRLDAAPAAPGSAPGLSLVKPHPQGQAGLQADRDEADRATVLSAAEELDAQSVFVATGSWLAGERLRRLSWAVHESGRALSVLPGIVEVASRRVGLSSAAGLTLLHVAAPVGAGLARTAKSVGDRVAALLLLVTLTPLLLALALTVKLSSRGPALHRQTRVGQHGEPFTMYKFRSMVVHAERLRDVLAEHNDHDGRMFKLRRDPRITRVGAVLRRYSLDELPQLLNVLMGHMSLVGPRPPLPAEVADYTPVELRRLRVRPGLTGLWQVSGRSDLTWDETVTLDLRYVDNWSLGVDAQVLARTLRAVAEGRGAY